MHKLIFGAFVALCLACAAQGNALEHSVRSAINVLTDVGDPACALAKQTCLLRQDLALTQAEGGDRDKVEVFKRITARCADVMDTCATMRTAQQEAAQLLDDGKVEAAALEVERVKDAWRGLSPDAAEEGTP
jgi:hypothetical protein